MSLNSEPQNPAQRQTGYATLHQEGEENSVTRGTQTTSFEIDSSSENRQRGEEKTISPLWIYVPFSMFLGNIIVFVLLVISTFALGDMSFQSLDGAMGTLSHNLNKDPILDLNLLHHKEGCPRNFEKAIIGTWPGTAKGCKCPGDRVERYPCTLKNTETCFYVERINPVELYDWHQSSICVRRAIQEREYVKNPVCPSGFRECSPGLCFLDSLECPITSLIISENESGSVGVLTNETRIRHLVPLRNKGKSPLVDFTITPNGVPCFSSGETPPGAKAPYALLREINGCVRYGTDTEWSFAIDEQTQEDLFMNTEVPLSLANVLPDYADAIHNTYVVLSGRNRITVKNIEECLNLDQELLAISPGYHFRRMKIDLFWLGLLIFCFNFFFVYLAAQFGPFERGFGEKLQEVIKKENFQDWLLINFVLVCLKVFGLAILLFKLNDPYFVLAKSAQYFQELTQMGCFPVAQPSQVLEDFMTLVHDVATPPYTYSLLIIIFTIGLGVSSWLTWRKGRKLRKNEISLQ